MTRPAAESWAIVDEILARPAASRVAGQLAAFAFDTPAAPLTFDSVVDVAAQLALFDPEVSA